MHHQIEEGDYNRSCDGYLTLNVNVLKNSVTEGVFGLSNHMLELRIAV